LHELASYVVDGSYVIRVDRMPQAEPIHQQCHANETWLGMKYGKRPTPGTGI
jgi:hypothetical protein